jgi:hypothetical protein
MSEPNILPYGFDRLSHGNSDSLIDKAKQQDLERSIRKDEEYCNIYGENKVFSEIPDDPCVPCDGSRLDVVQAGTYRKTNQISIINPAAYQAYLNREIKIKKLKEKMELEEFQALLEKANEKHASPITFLTLSPLFKE